MLNQSFSSDNFENVYNLLNRRGEIDINMFSDEYKHIVSTIHGIQNEIKDILRIKHAERTAEQEKKLVDLTNTLNVCKGEKNNILSEELFQIASKINERNFHFSLLGYEHEGKEEFCLEKNALNFFAMQQLLYNIKDTFNVKLMSRHSIISCIKSMLISSTPRYIIRTDVSCFFESIPQDKLLGIIDGNTILSHKSKSLVKGILAEYNNVKIPSIDTEKGVPRGIGISPILSEIYMQQIDKLVRNRDGVIYYARYVDDIFIILSTLGEFTSIEGYYDNIVSLFDKYSLQLKPIGSAKCQLISLNAEWINSPKTIPHFDYLGYKFIIYNQNKSIALSLELSSNKVDSIKSKIDKAFLHFEMCCEKSLRQSRKDLIDCLNVITGNYHLSKAKHRIKVGLYYTNGLIDYTGGMFKDLTNYLQSKPINLSEQLFVNQEERDKYINAIKRRIRKIDFDTRWETKKMYCFSHTRISQIISWL